MIDFSAARVTGMIEPGRSGDWCVEQFSSTHAETPGQLRELLQTGRYVPLGVYTRLTYRGRVIMSDTPDELRDLAPVLRRGRGRVLVHGLGLGCVIRALLAKREVEHIDVVEQSADVIALTARYYAGDRCTVHQGDAFNYAWPDNARWDVVWNDIWPDLRDENLAEMDRLHRRFQGRCRWQGSWGREFLLDQRLGLTLQMGEQPV